MPSRPHEALVLLFRNRPSLAPELLREALGVALPPNVEAHLAPTDLTEVAPAQYLADLVVLLRTDPPRAAESPETRPVLAVVVEAQLRRDTHKRLSWPVYLATARARHRCEALVMVVAPESKVARWASAPIVLGPGSVMRPWVLGPERVPVVTDATRARTDPELAVLSVMAHGRGNPRRAAAIAAAAAAGVGTVKDRDLYLLYSDLIGAALGEAARKAFEMLPRGYQFQTESLREAIAKGRNEGRNEARAEERALAVLEVLDARGLPVSAEQRRHVLDCNDVDTLARWLRRAATVTRAADLFA
jgi:hypothetical protein